VFQRESDFDLGLLPLIAQGNLSHVRLVLDQALKLGLSVSKSQAGSMWLYDGRFLVQVSHINTSTGTGPPGQGCLNDLPRGNRPFSQFYTTKMSAYPRLEPSRGLTGTCFMERKHIVSDDLISDERSFIAPDDAAKQNLRACAAAPIGLGEFTVGVITVFRTIPQAYEPDILDKLCLHGTKTALCLHHCLYFPSIMDDWLKVLSESESKGEMRPETLRPAIGLEKRQGAAQDAAGEPAQAHTYLRGLSLPKGIQPATLKIIWESVENSDTPVSCNEVAEMTGFTAVTVRRYLNYLVRANILSQKLQYGNIGRPAFVYTVLP
jgi:hypothetical protein